MIQNYSNLKLPKMTKTFLKFEINNIEDVDKFISLIVKAGLNFHPDERAEDYVHMSSGLKTFTEDEAKQFDNLVAKCSTYDLDLYEITVKYLEEELNS